MAAAAAAAEEPAAEQRAVLARWSALRGEVQELLAKVAELELELAEHNLGRRWEDWEAPYYATAAATVVLLAVGLTAKPDTSITKWARAEALRRAGDAGSGGGNGGGGEEDE
eukprot:SM000003S11180  [mRNA]  locus=s3:1435899:1438386:+ [translate_table: standard]